MPLRVTPEASGDGRAGRTARGGPPAQAETTDEADHIKTTPSTASSDTASITDASSHPEAAPDEILRSFDDVVRLAALDLRDSGADQAGGTARRVGIELEWFVVDVAYPQRSVPPGETAEALAGALGSSTVAGGSAPGAPSARRLPRLPGGSRLTFEPGGQLELSGPPLPLAGAVAAMRGDLALVRSALARRGLGIAGLGVDPLRPSRRHSSASRYLAMEEHFLASGGEAGLTMMCSTASVQVNLDAGTDGDDVVARFRLAHALEPVLIAMFAASPVAAGRQVGWQSGRQAVWGGIDPSRTASVLPDPATAAEPTAPRGADDLAVLWARYLCDAKLMMVAGDDGRYQAVRGPMTFGDWLTGAASPAGRPPTRQDLVWHATTLFPPVRPRGWLELRYLDAQPSALWPVAVAVPTMLLDDPHAARAALTACLPVAGRGQDAARLGLSDPELFRAAVRCADLTVDALARAGDTELRAAVEDFAVRYTRRRRSPSDDLSARFEARGAAELLREEVSQCLPVP